jgi:16S rRNA (uracil1498-N3)-methyltransferase
MDLIVQKATELGVTELSPLQSDRSISLVEDDKAETRRAKWHQLTIEAAKQCGQNWLPAVGLPLKPRDFFNQASRFQIKLVASLQAEAKPLKEVLREQCAEFPSPRSIALLIGPEGDFTPAEMGEARAAGFLPVSLGPIVLRSETAALYTLGAILYELS